MQFVRYCLLCLILAAPVLGQQENGNPLIAKHESERRGCFIETTGGNAAGDDDGMAAFLAALAPAENDNDKWSINVVSTKNCKYCEKLKKDFRSSPHLESLVNVQDHTKSWAHYQEFDIENQLQNWRFSKVKFDGFPAIILQPPRSGRCGNPDEFIKLSGYNGDDKTLFNVIRSEIRKHTKAVSKASVKTEYTDGPQPLTVEEFRKFQEELRQQRNGDAEEQYAESNILDLFFSNGESMTTLALFGIVGFLLLREYRKETGKQLVVSDGAAAIAEKVVKLDDATLVAIVTAVRKAVGNAPSLPPSAT